MLFRKILLLLLPIAFFTTSCERGDRFEGGQYPQRLYNDPYYESNNSRHDGHHHHDHKAHHEERHIEHHGGRDHHGGGKAH